MATSKFYLKNANKDGFCPVVFVYQDKGKKFKYYTKAKVMKDRWDGRRTKGKSLEDLENNDKIEKVEKIIKDIERDALTKEKIYDIETVEKIFRNKTNSDAEQSEFWVLHNQFIEESRITKAPKTISEYTSTRATLKEFEKFTGKKISFENINQRLYESLISFSIEEKKHLNNTIGKNIKSLKTFLNYVLRNELTNVKINLKGFKVFKEEIDIIHLTEDELFKMYYLKDLPEHFEFVKDYFCFECFTGLRFSDISKLRNENVKGDFLEFKTQKTRDTLYVPLSVFAKQILAKYMGKFEGRPLPPTFHNAVTNFYLKDIAELAGINDETIVEKFSGSKRLEFKKPKSAFVSTHTGRRTFITLSHEKGMPVEMIMKITGIRKWETLRKYLKVSEKAKLIQMNKVWNLNSSKAI